MYQAFYRDLQPELPLLALFLFIAVFAFAAAYAWGSRKLREGFAQQALMPLADDGFGAAGGFKPAGGFGAADDFGSLDRRLDSRLGRGREG